MGARFWRSGVIVSMVAGLLGTAAGLSRAGENEPRRPGELAIDLSTFAERCAVVEAELAKEAEGGLTRADLLATFGRSSAASGDFESSAAAYVMFLKEFGGGHPYSERIAARLLDSLAPLSLDSVDIRHTPKGPRFDPVWRMGQAASEQRLHQAVLACEYAAALVKSPADKGQALLRMGWIERALNDWAAATAAWERCAAEAGGTPAATEALWLAAENQRWTRHPAEAAELLQRLLREECASSTGARIAAARREIEALEAEARRDAAWLRDPVAALQAEIEQRRNSLAPQDVYREVVTWLSQHGEQAARLAVARWGLAQSGWPLPARLAAHAELVDALLAATPPTDAAKAEAATVLRALVDLAPDDSWLVPTAIRRSVLLRDMGRASEATEMWTSVAKTTRDPEAWGASVLPEQIKALVATGDHVAARQSFEELARKYPEHPELEALRAIVGKQAEEGK